MSLDDGFDAIERADWRRRRDARQTAQRAEADKVRALRDEAEADLDSIDDEFLRVWLRWDLRPGDVGRVNDFADATAAEAERLGLSSLALVDRMMAGRRAGVPHELVLAEIRGEL